MSNVEKQLTELENESKALHAAFEQSAGSLRLFHKTIKFKGESVWIAEEPGSVFGHRGRRRVCLTYETTLGIRTIAQLDSGGGHIGTQLAKRVPYDKGARWIIRTDSEHTLTVHAMLDGKLTAEIIK